MFRASGAHAITGLTAAGGTAIKALIPPLNGVHALLTSIRYRCAATAHTITMLKALGITDLASSAAASATSIVLSADPGAGTPSGAIATNDWVCVELDDGTYFLDDVSVSGLTLTIAALPAAASAGRRVWTFGVPGDHPVVTNTIAGNPKPNPKTGSAIVCTASVLNQWEDYAAGLCRSLNPSWPLMIHSDNGTNAGTFEQIGAVYARTG